MFIVLSYIFLITHRLEREPKIIVELVFAEVGPYEVGQLILLLGSHHYLHLFLILLPDLLQHHVLIVVECVEGI